MANRNLGGVYANMEFKPYQYQEYPKHIRTGDHGQYTVVYDATEERALLNSMKQIQDNEPAYVAPLVADPEKEILISRCRELGVAFNSKWSKQKLLGVVRDAEAAVDDLPPEEAPTKKAKVEEPEEIDDTEQEIVDQDALKDKLIAQAKELGIPNVNRLWGIPRLQLHISEAQAKLK